MARPGDGCQWVCPDVRRLRQHDGVPGTAVRPDGRRGRRGRAARVAAPPRSPGAAPTGPALRLRPRPLARRRRRRARPPLPEPDRASGHRRSTPRPPSRLRAARGEPRRDAGQPAAPRPTRSAAARCCCPRSGCLAAEVGPLAHLDVGSSAGLNLLIDRYRYRYEPGGTVGPSSSPDRARVRDPGRRPRPGVDPHDRHPPRHRPAARRRHRRRRGPVAGGVCLAGPARPLRPPAGRDRDGQDRRHHRPGRRCRRRDRTAGGIDRLVRASGRHQHVGAQLPERGRSGRRTSSRSTSSARASTCPGCTSRARTSSRSCPGRASTLPLTGPCSSWSAGGTECARSTTSPTPTPTATGCTGSSAAECPPARRASALGCDTRMVRGRSSRT